MPRISLNLCSLALGVLTLTAAVVVQAQTTMSPAPAASTATPPAAAPQVGLTPQASAAAIEDCTSKTEALLDALDKGDYASATTNFDDTMRAGLSAQKLQQGWESLAKFGQRGARGMPQNTFSNGYTVITVPMPFQNGSLAAQVACEADGKVAGFHVMTLPPPEPAQPATAGSAGG